MVGHRCTVCDNTSHLDPDCSFHRFPSHLSTRLRWVQVLGINKSNLRKDFCICSSHFPTGDIAKGPKSNLGKRFASPIKRKLPRVNRAKRRDLVKDISAAVPTVSGTMSTAAGSVNSTDTNRPVDGSVAQSLTTIVGEQLCSDYGVHELPTDFGDDTSETHPVSVIPSDVSSLLDSSSSLLSSEGNPSTAKVLVISALLARIEVLEAENCQLKTNLGAKN